jgi:hypothetical protein
MAMGDVRQKTIEGGVALVQLPTLITNEKGEMGDSSRPLSFAL